MIETHKDQKVYLPENHETCPGYEVYKIDFSRDADLNVRVITPHGGKWWTSCDLNKLTTFTPPKQEPKKMTVAQVSEELGYDVEIVKG